MGSKKHKKHHKHDKAERKEHDDSNSGATGYLGFGNTGNGKEIYGIHKPGESSSAPGIRLVLKVGGSGTPERSITPTPAVSINVPPIVVDEDSRMSTFSHGEERRREKHKKHKKEKKKKKEKHKHRHHHKDKRKRHFDEMSPQGVAQNEESSLSELPLKKMAVDSSERVAVTSDGDSGQQAGSPVKEMTGVPKVTSPRESHQEVRTCVLKQRSKKNRLALLLDHFLKNLEKKDPQQFFAFPVTDLIAPGYSSIITNPMDFSIIRSKIDDGDYTNLGQFVDDFKLMCNNAMIYNRQDTVYYKAAKRLLHVGMRMMSAEKLRSQVAELPWLAELTVEELGFEVVIPSIESEGEKEEEKVD